MSASLADRMRRDGAGAGEQISDRRAASARSLPQPAGKRPRVEVDLSTRPPVHRSTRPAGVGADPPGLTRFTGRVPATGRRFEVLVDPALHERIETLARRVFEDVDRPLNRSLLVRSAIRRIPDDPAACADLTRTVDPPGECPIRFTARIPIEDHRRLTRVKILASGSQPTLRELVTWALGAELDELEAERR